MGLSRAGFLKQLAGSALEALPVLAPMIAPVMAGPRPLAEPAAASAWLEIGTLGDFAPGTASPVLAGRYVVLAHARGLYALSAEAYASGQTGPRLALRLEPHCALALHPRLHWPDRACLSALTGNRIDEDPDDSHRNIPDQAKELSS